MSEHKSLSDGKALLYNPTPSEDGKKLASVEYHIKGGSSLVITDTENGMSIFSIKAPDGLQLVETAWIGEDVYVTGITEGGYGIYRLGEMTGDKGAELEPVLKPEPVMIKDFRSYVNELILFTFTYTGAHEWTLKAFGNFLYLFGSENLTSAS